MIQLYPKGQTTFSANGIELHPSENEVTWQDGGRYDFSMSIPREAAEGITLDYGMILKVSVPPQHIGAISLGAVSYWATTAATKLYSQVPSTRTIKYDAWTLKGYTAGDKVSYGNKNYQANHAIPPLTDVAPSVSSDWTEIQRYESVPGKEITTLASGTSIMKVSDFNSTYMEVATLTGYQGYVATADCASTGQSGERTIPAFDITEQFFTINHIDKETDQHNIRVEAEHISYQLGRTILGECSVVGVSPATALLFITGAMQEAYPGNLYCGIDDGIIDADWSWKNAQSAILDPQNGLLKAIAARAIRDNLDVYIIENAEEDTTYEVRYGVNMKNVKWTGDVTGIVTRVYPIAQREDGTRIMLPEKYIDSVRTVPYIRPEVLDTKLKVGQKVENSDGTEVELTEDEVLTRMRAAAQDRFDIDHCDMAEVTLELDWVHMPDTEEYRQYLTLQNAAPAEWVRVVNGPMGVNTAVQLTSYVWDAILLRYKKTGFGDKKQKPTISGYDIKSGAVTNRALSSGAVRGENIAAGTITAREIEAGSITAEQIASRIITTELLAANAVTTNELNAGAVTANKIAAHTITSDEIDAGSVRSAVIAAGLITANDINAESVRAAIINAGKINADDINAQSVRAAIIDAGKITANDIEAYTITADKISANFFQGQTVIAGVASIANAQISNADISYAKIKDLSADTAVFDTTITDRGVASFLYIARLAVTYGQMVNATIGDLVLGATNGNYYHIDVHVDQDGNPYMVPTLVQVSEAEIAAGHTTEGKTILGNVGTFAELSSEYFYAIDSVIDRITAKRIDVDELWARQAFINKLMVQDISSNTYIQSTIGNWVSSSTITQEINSLNSKISTLGYGTVYFSPTEPSHEDLTEGDIWVKSSNMQDWKNVYDDYDDWEDVYDGFDDWQTIGSVQRMYVWDGVAWSEMYDSNLPDLLQTEINQLATEITLKASLTQVDTLAGEVSDFSAQLTIQAQEIQSAVSAVNQKAASYVTQEDPRTYYTVSVGDIWIKWDGTTDWESVYDNYDDWEEIYDTFDEWAELTGAKTYVWNGTEWVETSDRASEIYQQTLIDQTNREIQLMASEQATLSDNMISMQASLRVTAEQIATEVSRATTAEAGKIDKTSTLQTATAIVNEAVRQAASAASGAYIAKTTTLQTATAIVNEAVSQAATAAAGAYIAKTSSLQTADAIQNEAVRLSGLAAAAAYIAKTSNYSSVDDIIGQAQTLANNAATTAKNASIAKTSTYQSAAAIVNAAVAQAATAAGNTYIAKTASYQTADAIVNAAESYVDGELESYSTTTQTSTMISQYVGSNAYGKVSGITIETEGIDISGSQYVRIASGGAFRVTSGNFGIKSDAGTNEYVIWSGASTAATSPFRVTKSGEVTLTKLKVQGEDGTETEVNLRTGGLWKLNYHTIKQVTSSGGYVSAMTLSNGTTVNFNSAAAVEATAAEVQTSGPLSRTWYINVGLSNGKTTQNLVLPVGNQIDACETYYTKEGWNDCLDECEGDWYLTGYDSIGYGTMGYVDSGGTFHPMGTGNWYLGGSQAYRYTIPNPKT